MDFKKQTSFDVTHEGMELLRVTKDGAVSFFGQYVATNKSIYEKITRTISLGQDDRDFDISFDRSADENSHVIFSAPAKDYANSKIDLLKFTPPLAEVETAIVRGYETPNNQTMYSALVEWAEGIKLS